MARYRLEHKTLADGCFHVVTSPDVKGFHVTAETLEAGLREAVDVLSAIEGLKEVEGRRQRLVAVEFDAA